MGSIIYECVWWAFQLYAYAIIYYVFSSWIPALRENRFGQWIEKIVSPYLDIFRKFIPPIGMIDVSPIVAILVYNYVIQRFVLAGLLKVLMMAHLM